MAWRLDRAFRSVLTAPPPSATSGPRDCAQRSLQEPWIDTTTPIGEAIFHITIAWAGLEKQTLSERTRAGMERAREEGKQVGRPRRRPLDHRHLRELRRLAPIHAADLLARYRSVDRHVTDYGALMDRLVARGRVLAVDRASVLAFVHSRYLAAPVDAAR